MNLGKKKQLVKRTLHVGEDRVFFVQSRLGEIKEAITKQDIRDLVNSRAIIIKNVKGRKKVIHSQKRRHAGKVRKNTDIRKTSYVFITRKLRKYLKEMENQKKISKIQVVELRKKIKNRQFKSKEHLKEYLGGIKKWNYLREGEENSRQTT